MATEEINLANIQHGYMSTNTDPLVCRHCSSGFDDPRHSATFEKADEPISTDEQEASQTS